ncbi:MAG: prolyl oligopeptidase family serine peptidase [Thermoguttaceae bacterium]|nr:prolyl oligopeptidase family serine peptidase [Thermoguttaceae bacterium]
MSCKVIQFVVRLSTLVLFISTFSNVFWIFAAEPQSGPIEATFIEFASDDGTKEFYYEYVPETFDPAKTSTLIVALHGHGSECGQVFNGVYNEFRATNDIAATHNAVVVSPNYGSITSWMGPEGERDLLLILEHQKSKRRYDRVVLSGGSMGASSTLTFVALHPELIDGAVSMNGTANHLEYENFQEAISESFGGSKSEIPLEYKKRSAEYYPENFLNVPIAITLGSLDTVVPPDSARRLAETIRKIGGTVLLIERGDIGHSTPYDESLQAFEFVFKELDSKTARE